MVGPAVPPSMALSIFSMCIFVSKPTSVHGRCRLLVDVFSLCSGPQPPRRSPRLPSPPPFLPVSPLPRPAQRRRTRADVHGRARHGRDNLHYETCSDDSSQATASRWHTGEEAVTQMLQIGATAKQAGSGEEQPAARPSSAQEEAAAG
ncbi:hypothetical protein U9M48_035594 [Paspalum notatum var. saurae]|uniref:Uncharacterized protein n=1 Tax=Paspalum notatum var. saurae TaxID=547442 RepID=A0AAQ3X8K5_PASNO